MLGQQDCSLQRGTFDPAVGREVYLSFREEPSYAESHAEVQPLTLLVTTGMMRTPHGLVAFIVWQIAVGSPHQIAVDHYINPQNVASVSLLADAGSQTHFKLLIWNNVTSAVTAFVDFENTFELGGFAEAISQLIVDQQVGDFEAASQYVLDNMSVADLLELGQKN